MSDPGNEEATSTDDTPPRPNPGSGDIPADATKSAQKPEAAAVPATSASSTASAGAVEDPGNDDSMPVINAPTVRSADTAAESAGEDPDIEAMLREIGWESRGPSVRTNAPQKPPGVRGTRPP